MTDFAVYVSRLSTSTTSLRQIDDALSFFAKASWHHGDLEFKTHAEQVATLLIPLLEAAADNLTPTIQFNEKMMVENLKARHPKNWQRFIIELRDLSVRLRAEDFRPNSKEISILNDIADALDAECEELFKRINARY